MRIDPATLGLAFSGISALVVIVGAFAAVRQIQHLRRGNELAAITKFVDEWSSAEFAADRMRVRDDLAQMLRKHATMEELRGDPRATGVFRVVHFFERLAFFVRRGAISEVLAMELFGIAATQHWEVTRDFVLWLREVNNTNTPMEWFEDFAMRAPEWAERNERRSKHLRRDPKAVRRRVESPFDEGVSAPET